MLTYLLKFIYKSSRSGWKFLNKFSLFGSTLSLFLYISKKWKYLKELPLFKTFRFILLIASAISLFFNIMLLIIFADYKLINIPMLSISGLSSLFYFFPEFIKSYFQFLADFFISIYKSIKSFIIRIFKAIIDLDETKEEVDSLKKEIEDIKTGIEVDKGISKEREGWIKDKEKDTER